MNTFWTIVLIIIMLCLVESGISGIKEIKKNSNAKEIIKVGASFGLIVSILISFFIFPDYFLASTVPPFILTIIFIVIGIVVAYVISWNVDRKVLENDKTNPILNEILEDATQLLDICNNHTRFFFPYYIFVVIHPKTGCTDIFAFLEHHDDKDIDMLTTLCGGSIYPFSVTQGTNDNVLLKCTTFGHFSSRNKKSTDLVYNLLRQNYPDLKISSSSNQVIITYKSLSVSN